MGKTLIQKILQHKINRPVAIGEVIEIPVDLAWGSEMTLKFAIDILKENELLDEPYDSYLRSNAEKIMFPFDHLSPATDAKAASLMVDLREFANKYHMRIFEVGYDGGIQHRLFEERGFLFPGTVGVGGDSHSCTYGALGAVGTGIGSTDLAAVMVSGKTWLQVPGSIYVQLTGKPKKYVSGKDVILYLLGILGVDGATYQSLEFNGDGIEYLDMASRFTISNMAVESGAKFGLFPVDHITIDYLSNTVAKNFPHEIGFDPREIEKFRSLIGDDDADYTRRIAIDLNKIEPMVALPYLPANTIGIHQLNYILNHKNQFPNNEIIGERLAAITSHVDREGNIPIQQIFIGSCTNGRIEDLQTAAGLLEGKRVSPGVRAIIIPASQQVYRQALKEGLIEIFIDSGCYVESSSCGPCIGMKSGVMGKSEAAIFTSNRNFYGRTGDKRSLVLLASPAVAAASAVEGKLTSPGQFEDYYSSEQKLVQRLSAVTQTREKTMTDIETIFYQATVKNEHSTPGVEGYTAWCFGDNINTDLIMPSRYCNITNPTEYKKYICLDTENEEFLDHFKNTRYTLKHDLFVAGKNFGCGSSRESAPMGIKTAGVKFVVAHSFARIFYRNAINIGLPLFEIGNAAYRIQQGDKLTANFDTGAIFNVTKGEVYQAKPMGKFQKNLYQTGGLIPSLKKNQQVFPNKGVKVDDPIKEA